MPAMSYIRKTRELLAARMNSQSQALEIQLFRERTRDISPMLPKLAEANRLSATAHRYTDVELPQLSRLLEFWNELNNEYEENGVYSITSGNRLSQLLRDVERAASEISAVCAKAWQVYKETILTSFVDEALLTRVENVEGRKNSAGHVRDLQNQISSTAPPKSDSEFEAFRKILDEWATEKEDLDLDSLPDSVVKFFEAVSAGAPLGAINAELISWLRQEGQYDQYVVVRKSTRGYQR